MFLWFVLQIIETFYILLWDQKIIRSPVWHQSAACASDKSVKENGANQQRVRVASVQAHAADGTIPKSQRNQKNNIQPDGQCDVVEDITADTKPLLTIRE